MKASVVTSAQGLIRLGDAPNCKFLELVQRYKAFPSGTVVIKYQHDNKTYVRALATLSGSSPVLRANRIDTTDQGIALGGTLCRILQNGTSFTITIDDVD